MINRKLVFIGNCDAQGSTHPTGANAIKATFKGYRWLRYLDSPEDIAIIHLPCREDYREYWVRTFGFCPQIFCPSEVREPIDLAVSMLGDDNLLNKIKACMQVTSYTYELVASVNTKEVFGIGEKLGLKVAEPAEGQIKSGLLGRFNDKIEFIKRFDSLGFATPGGKVALGKDEIIKNASNMRQACEGIMLRKPSEANSVGNLPLVNMSKQEMIERIQNLSEDWTARPLLVEPYLDLEDSPCTLGMIYPDGSGEVLISGTQIFSPSAYCWITPPNYQKNIIDEMENKFATYVQSIAGEGALGWVDIDWGRTKDDQIIGIESNYRMTGWTSTAQFIRRIFGKDRDKYPGLFACDTVPLRQQYSLQDILDKLSSLGILYTRHTHSGVIVSASPSDIYVGLVVIASTHQKIWDILAQLDWLTAEFMPIVEKHQT